jgi:hypothetical protein
VEYSTTEPYPQHGVPPSGDSPNAQTTPSFNAPATKTPNSPHASHASLSSFPSFRSLPSFSSNPTTPPPADPTSTLPAPIDSQDNFEILFDPNLSFQTHAKKRSPLDRLPTEHQEEIIRLLHDHPLESVAELLARPLPCGLNIKTSPAALSRFSHRYTRAKTKRDREQKILTAEKILHDIDIPTQGGFEEISSRMLKMRILANSSESDPDLKDLHILVNCYTKLRRQSLAERKEHRA